MEELANLTQLEELNLSGNQVKSVTRLTEQSVLLPSLRTIDLSQNNLQVLHPRGEVNNITS